MRSRWRLLQSNRSRFKVPASFRGEFRVASVSMSYTERSLHANPRSWKTDGQRAKVLSDQLVPLAKPDPEILRCSGAFGPVNCRIDYKEQTMQEEPYQWGAHLTPEEREAALEEGVQLLAQYRREEEMINGLEEFLSQTINKNPEPLMRALGLPIPNQPAPETGERTRGAGSPRPLFRPKRRAGTRFVRRKP